MPLPNLYVAAICKLGKGIQFKNESGQSLLARNSLGWITLEERRAQMKARLMYKSINKLAPQRLSNFFKIQMQCKIMI